MALRLARLIIFLPTLGGCHAQDGTLRLGAAASLSDVLPPLLASAEASIGVPIQAIYGSSGDLTAQVRHGADLDAIFVASQDPIHDLQQAGFLEEISGPRIRNRLVLVGAGDADSESLSSALDGAERVGIGTLGVPAGDYARTWLESEGLNPDPLVEFAHVRAVLACVESGSCELGFVYATDTLGHSNLKPRITWEESPSYGFATRVGADPEAWALGQHLAAASASFEAFGFIVEAP